MSTKIGMASTLKKTEMLLVVEKGIRGEIVYAIYQYATANNKYMKD